MRGPYIVMEANPKKLPYVNIEGAQALRQWLISEKVRGRSLCLERFKSQGSSLEVD